MTTLCTNFKQNRPTFISKSAPVSQAEALKSLLTLVVENVFSEMRAGASDMPMQLQFDFRFSRAMKEHLKQMCTTRFSYYTGATSHYPRVKSDLKYSALPKMSPPSTAHLTKATSSANERLAHEVWSKCSTEDCAT